MSSNPPMDEVTRQRKLAELCTAVAQLPPDRRQLLASTLEDAAQREEQEKMATKKTTKKTADKEPMPPPLSLRLPPAILDGVDRAAEQIKGERPELMTVGRTDAIRVLLAEALAGRKIPIR